MTGVDADGMASGEGGRIPAKPGPVRQTGALPDFVLIGAQKGGTTTLYRLLGQHPSVRPAARKELHYFSTQYARGLDWYRGCFPDAEASPGTITGEGSPYYLFHPHSPRRMAETVPDVRLIAMLRNPVDRAYSHHRMLKNMGEEPLGFEEALEAEEGRLRGELEKMLADELYVSFDHQYFSYLSRGLYVDQLLRWSGFFRRDQMLVLRSEDFFERPMETLNQVLAFLGLTKWEPEEWEIVLKGEYDGGMNPQTRRRLKGFYRPHNERLYEYLGRDMGW